MQRPEMQRSTIRCGWPHLAYDAGMLIEPEEYSAWTLYAASRRRSRAIRTAVHGLNKVADDLVRRGETALEQGRFDDARRIVERIRAAMPRIRARRRSP